ncbi:MAG: T9SS type A sorting domain-containing protein [Ferruginibacter sp.]
MKRLLLSALYSVTIALFTLTTAFSQFKGAPQPQAKVKPLTELKDPSRMSPELKNLHDNFTAKAQKKTIPSSLTDGLQNFMQIKGDKVLVDFTAKTDVNSAKKELQKMGVTVTASYGRVISGLVPISILPQLENAATIRFARASFKPRHQSVKDKSLLNKSESLPPGNTPTPVVSQGDTAQYSYLARKKSHVDGQGVKIGVLSDSYDNLGSADLGVTQGELPGKGNPFGYKKPVQVLSELDGGGSDEGRAMMEILHDVSPASQLAFYSAFNGQADFAQGIQTLADNGCKVITDDIFYYAEPFFQDGIIAQSVDIAKKRGVSYFSAAGNSGNNSYEDNYHPTDVEIFGPGFGTAHNFNGPGEIPNFFQPLYVPQGGGVLVMSFQWDQSFFSASGVGATTDFDIFLTDIYGNIVAAAYADNIASGDPVEVMGFQNFTNNYTFFLTIIKYAGPDVNRIKYNLYNDAQFFTPFPGIFAPSLVGHPKAEGAIATGAAAYFNTPAYGLDQAYINYFSALGGVPNYFDIDGNRIAPLIRKKPNIVAPDGGNTSFFDPFGNGDISFDPDSYPNFFGTSAAAPHAAGVAALMMDAEKLKHITPEQIKGVLSATALDMDDPYTSGFDAGFDYATGYGFINAEKAVKEVKFPNLYINDLKLDPLCSNDPLVVRNWKINNPNPFAVDVSWFLQGSHQNGSLTVQPGVTTFSTNTIGLPNILVISWKDNFGFPRFDLAFSTKAKCGLNKPDDNNSDRPVMARAGTAAADAANIILADVYPNPSTSSFRLYLSLSKQQATNIELYSIDGRKLQSKTYYQAKGVIDIDASNYRPGVYLVNVKQGNFIKTIKVVKQ